MVMPADPSSQGSVPVAEVSGGGEDQAATDALLGIKQTEKEDINQGEGDTPRNNDNGAIWSIENIEGHELIQTVGAALEKLGKERIRNMELALEILQKRNPVVAENGEVSSIRYGDCVLDFTTTFEIDGHQKEEKLNVVLVPSALVEPESFPVELKGKIIDFIAVSPQSEIGKRIVNASI